MKLNETDGLQEDRYAHLPLTYEGIPCIACHAIGGYPLPKWKQSLREMWGALIRYHPAWIPGGVDVAGTKRQAILRFREWRRTREGRDASHSYAVLKKELIRTEVEGELLRDLERLNQESRMEAERFREHQKCMAQILGSNSK